ncbi:MAG: thioredoxin domain-containing protein [Candidatus Binatia bacterium]
MKSQKLAALLALGLCLGTLSCQQGSTGTTTAGASPASGDDVVARVGSREITLADLDSKIEAELKRIEMDRYRARKGKLDEIVSEELVAQKAKALGVSTDELAQREVASKVPAPEEATVKEFYDRLKAQGQTATFEELAPRIRQALSQQAMSSRQEEYLSSLRKETKVEIALEPPRIPVDTTSGVAKGPQGAPITLVEFSDYQCPFCARSQETVKQVLAKYEGKIHHVFMDFPLSSIHPMAMPASQAGRCAADQGKFWEYHHVLFERQRELTPDNFKKWAGELALDQKTFDACLASGKHDEAIRKSLEAGQKAGVNGTPGFFVNGILINGAQPLDVFAETIEGELARAGQGSGAAS